MCPRWALKGFVEQPPRTPPRCQVTSLPLPGTHKWPQASCQLTLLCPGAIVTCKRKKCPHERHQDHRGHLHSGGKARTSDPSIPLCHPCDVSPQEPEQLVDGFWFLAVCLQGLECSQVRAGGARCHQLWVLMSGSCHQEQDILIREAAQRIWAS